MFNRTYLPCRHPLQFFADRCYTAQNASKLCVVLGLVDPSLWNLRGIVRPESPCPMRKTMRHFASYEYHHGCSHLEPGMLGSVCEGVPADNGEKQLVTWPSSEAGQSSYRT